MLILDSLSVGSLIGPLMVRSLFSIWLVVTLRLSVEKMGAKVRSMLRDLSRAQLLIEEMILMVNVQDLFLVANVVDGYEGAVRVLQVGVRGQDGAVGLHHS